MSAKQAPVRRALQLIFALQGHALEGVRLKDLAVVMQSTPSTVLRDLEVLADEGVVERIPGRDQFWRLTVMLVQIARAHEQEMTRARQRLDEIEQRYSRRVN